MPLGWDCERHDPEPCNHHLGVRVPASPHRWECVPVSSHAPSVKEKVFIVPVGANSKPDPASPQQQPSQGLPQRSLHRPKLLAGTAVAPDTEWGLSVQG